MLFVKKRVPHKAVLVFQIMEYAALDDAAHSIIRQDLVFILAAKVIRREPVKL